MSSSIIMATLAESGWDAHLPSLLDQSVPADECIVVVDRVTNQAERAAFADKWPRVTFSFNEQNIGLTKSLNVALSIARGEFIFRADDDDHYFDRRIELQLECFRRTGADFVCSWGEGARTGSTSRPYLIKAPETDVEIKKGLLKQNILLHPSLAFRRAAVDRLGGYDDTFVYAQDYALYLAAIRAGYAFAVVQQPLVRRFYSPSSISVRMRYRQMMFSCAAQALHCGHSGDRMGFLASLARYAMLASIPSSLRRMRRILFGLIGRGV